MESNRKIVKCEPLFYLEMNEIFQRVGGFLLTLLAVRISPVVLKTIAYLPPIHIQSTDAILHDEWFMITRYMFMIKRMSVSLILGLVFSKLNYTTGVAKSGEIKLDRRNLTFPLRECVNLEASNLYTWNESKFNNIRLEHTNQTKFKRNMIVLYYWTRTIDKERESMSRLRKLATFYFVYD